MVQRTARPLRRGVVAWFSTVAALIGAMIAVGGITRLTQSGLSMVTWDPIVGAVPPLSHAQWLDAFHKYQQTPQFRLTFPDLNLAGFQKIFFWEYLHRVIGRGVGLAVLLPGVWMGVRGRLDQRLRAQFGGMLVLVLAQGALGWFMVRSGLVNEPHVSQFRLAAHLSLALGMLGYVLWALFGELQHATPRSQPRPHDGAGRVGGVLVGFSVLLGIQIVYGALTAGLRAGLGYNTWPKMYGAWAPDVLLALHPLWKNAFYNPAGVQFIHRTLAIGVFLAVLALAFTASRAQITRSQRRCLRALVLLVLVQFALGVATLLSFVAIPLASLHQLVGCLLFAATVRANHAVWVADEGQLPQLAPRAGSIGPLLRLVRAPEPRDHHPEAGSLRADR